MAAIRPIFLNNVASTVQAGSSAIGSASATGVNVASGDGAKFGAIGTDQFIPAVIVDTSTNPATVKEYVYVTVRSTDALTIIRNAESASTYPASTTSIQAGYTIAAVVPAAVLALMGGVDPVTTVSASGTSQTLTVPASGSATYDMTLTGNCTLTFDTSAAPTGRVLVVTVLYRQDATGSRTLTHPLSVTSPLPVLTTTASHMDEVQYTSTDGGTTWIASMVAGDRVAITVPGAPTSLNATAGAAQVALTWTAPANDGASPITDYTIQYRTTAGPGSWNTFSHSASTATSATVTGLTNGTGYDFQVAAVNVAGTGSYSSTASATPSANHYLNLPGGSGNYVSSPSSTSPAADIDIRIKMAHASWAPAATSSLMGKWTGVTSTQGWVLQLTTAGKLTYAYRTATTLVIATSTVAVPFAAAATGWVRVYHDTAGGNITFYTSTNGTTWTTLGTAITGQATGAVHTVTTELEIGADSGGTGSPTTATIYNTQYANGSSGNQGTLISSIDWTAQTSGASTVTDAQGATWTLRGTASVN